LLARAIVQHPLAADQRATALAAPTGMPPP
jgi:hypothetical protein